MSPKRLLAILTFFTIATLLIAGCGGATQPPQETQEPGEEEHMEDEHMEDEHPPEEHMEGEHEVPEDAAAVPNPIDATEESIAMGAELYAQSCAVCHGENGEGDGPSAEGLDPKPADMHEEHVQELSDGALFYIISHGRPETAMPAWENQLDEEERWHVINFLRTFQEE